MSKSTEPTFLDSAKAADKSLAEKLAEVMLAVGGVPKRGHHQQFGYEFVTESDVKQAVRHELAKRGVVIVPLAGPATCRRSSKNDTDITVVPVAYTITDGRQTLEATAVGEGLDTQDKGATKAQTAALKTLLMGLFLLPSGEETADNDGSPAARRPPTSEPAAEPDDAADRAEVTALVNEVKERGHGAVAKFFKAFPMFRIPSEVTGADLRAGREWLKRAHGPEH